MRPPPTRGNAEPRTSRPIAASEAASDQDRGDRSRGERRPTEPKSSFLAEYWNLWG
jgi:hypothetical protein